jgi:predicted GNAT family acetyltransferase
MSRIEIEDDGKKGRFAIYENNEFAGEMTFTWKAATRIAIDHTGVEDDFKGEGMGKKMVLESVRFARKREIKIIPICPFAKHVFEKEEGINDVL